MKVVLSHVYSADNAGDGLLARLSAGLVHEAVGVMPQVIAVDPNGLENALHPITYGGSSRSAVGALQECLAAARIGHTEALTAFDTADIVVAVGGGYLRGRGRATMATAGVHFPQLVAETARPGKSIHLPQSIGPLPFVMQRWVHHRLARAGAVFLRDDRSWDNFRNLSNASRLPDVAALELGRLVESGAVATGRLGGETILVQARTLPASGWPQTLSTFIKELGRPITLGLQSVAGRTNDDTSLYQAMGVHARPMAELLEEPHQFAVAICGRLHAALACMMSGIPALHIAYERKSYGVYRDLGLLDYLISPDKLQSALPLLDQVAREPFSFWKAISERVAWLTESRSNLIGTIRAIADSS